MHDTCTWGRGWCAENGKEQATAHDNTHGIQSLSNTIDSKHLLSSTFDQVPSSLLPRGKRWNAAQGEQTNPNYGDEHQNSRQFRPTQIVWIKQPHAQLDHQRMQTQDESYSINSDRRDLSCHYCSAIIDNTILTSTSSRKRQHDRLRAQHISHVKHKQQRSLSATHAKP